MATFDFMAALEGETIEFRSKLIRTVGGDVVFYLHAPKTPEQALASQRSGLEHDDNGELSVPASVQVPQSIYLIEKNTVAQRHLARLCIDKIVGLDGWPENPHRQLSDTIQELTTEAWEMLLGPKRSTVLVDEIGEFLGKFAVDKAKKKHSAPQSSGDTPLPSTPNDTATGADAAGATTPTTASDGNVTVETDPFTTSEANGSTPAP